MSSRLTEKKRIGRSQLIWPVAVVMSVLSSAVLAAGVPVYPGSAADPVASAAKHAHVYLSRDSLQQVRSWYQARLAKRSTAACSVADSGCGAFKQDCETATGGDPKVRCSDLLVLKWNAIPPGGSMVDAYNAGVHLEGWRTVKKRQESAGTAAAPQPVAGDTGGKMAQLDAMLQRMQTMNQQGMQQMNADTQRETGVNAVALGSIPDMPFEGLKQEVIAGRHSQQELDAVYRKYRWLDNAYYPLQKTAQGDESYEHWLVKQTRSRIRAPQGAMGKAANEFGEGAAAVGARMQQLVAAGRMQEAQQLARQMEPTMQTGQQVGTAYGALQQKDHWNEWMAVIRQLAAHAYKTKIVIDTF